MRILLIALSLSSIAFSAFADNVVKDHYPKPEPGYRRVNIEPNNRDEIRASKSVKNVDLLSIDVGIMSYNCNASSLFASVEERHVEGYGSTYLVVKSEGDFLGSAMACSDLVSAAFVPAHLNIFKLPRESTVLYIPENLKVKVEYFEKIKIEEL